MSTLILAYGCVAFAVILLVALAARRSPEDRHDEQTDGRE